VAAEVAVAASVSLPTATFALSGTVAKTSAVFLRRDRRPGRVVLARVEHVGYLRQASRAGPDPDGNELPAVSRLVRDGLTEASRTRPYLGSALTITSTDPLVALVAADSLHTLDPSRLDPAAMLARRLIVDQGGMELRELLRARRATAARRADPPYISVLHVDELGTVDWHAVAEHTPITPGRLVEPGDIIVSLLNPSKLRAAVIPPQAEPMQVSGEFGVFTPTCDPYAVLGILYSRGVRTQLRPLGRGTSSSRRRIDVQDVLSLVVPRLSAESLRDLGRAVRDAETLVDQGRERLRRQFASVDTAASAPPLDTADSAPPDPADSAAALDTPASVAPTVSTMAAGAS
jgi:hypothetical protein